MIHLPCLLDLASTTMQHSKVLLKYSVLILILLASLQSIRLHGLSYGILSYTTNSKDVIIWNSHTT